MKPKDTADHDNLVVDHDHQPDQLVPDPKVAKGYNVTLMTLWRWDHDEKLAALGWPPPVVIRRRNTRSRNGLTQFNRRAAEHALATRSKRTAR